MQDGEQVYTVPISGFDIAEYFFRTAHIQERCINGKLLNIGTEVFNNTHNLL